MLAALYAIPTPLGGAPANALPVDALEKVRELRDFVAENAKSARAFLAAVGMPCPLQELRIEVLDKHTPSRSVAALLEPLRKGRALGLVSEAGCPAVADPGAALVEAAHREGFRVVPLIGPSSIVLALMASGLEGQCFAFSGYLPREAGETQIFIETPYRNAAMLASLLKTCAPATRLCVASDLTLPTETVRVSSVAQWDRTAPDALGRRPSVFLLLAR